MNTKRFLLAGCATIILSAGTSQAGPCDTAGKAASAKDAGSGPTVGNTGQTTVDLPRTGHCGARTSTEGEVL